MPKKTTAPWDNPHINKGYYDATIHAVRVASYGPEALPYVQILLHLPKLRLIIATNIYTSRNRTMRNPRLLHLCHAVGYNSGLANGGISALKGRRLRVLVGQNSVVRCGVKKTFSDVSLFLPTESTS